MATSPILRADPKTLPRRRTQPNQTNLTLFPSAARHGTCESPGIASAPTLVSGQRTKPATELVGIARLASSSPCADAKRGTEYFLLPVRSILNHCDSDRVPFPWTVNPYRGCEFGCKYCYARYTHEYMELDGGDFETQDLRQAGCRPARRARPVHRENLGRAHRHRHRHRSVPAGRARIRRHARDPRTNGRARRAEPLHHHEIGSGAARHGPAQADRRAFIASRELEHHDAAHAPGATARTARAAAGFAPRRGRANCAQRGNRRRRVRHAGASRALRIAKKIWMPWLAARAMPARSGCRQRAVPDAFIAQGNFCRSWTRNFRSSPNATANGSRTTATPRNPTARKSQPDSKLSAANTISARAPSAAAPKNNGAPRSSP